MEPIRTLQQNPEWIHVENIIRDQMADLLDIRKLDEKMSGDEMKLEIRARQLAVEKLKGFYERYSFIMKSDEVEALPFR